MKTIEKSDLLQKVGDFLPKLIEANEGESVSVSVGVPIICEPSYLPCYISYNIDKLKIF